MKWEFLLLHILAIFFFLKFSYFNRCMVVSRFNLQLCNGKLGWTSFHMLICHLNIFFGEVSVQILCLFFKKVLFINFQRGEERERERNINVWLPLMCHQLGTWPATQVCALTGNQTGDSLAQRPVLNPLSRTSQGWKLVSFKWGHSGSLTWMPFFSKVSWSAKLGKVVYSCTFCH